MTETSATWKQRRQMSWL